MGDGKHRQLGLVADQAPRAAYWRSLAEVAGVRGDDEGEFPEGADRPFSISRRRWIELVGASMALAGASGCQRLRGEKILPYTVNPRHVLPGVPRYYATSLELDGFATGVLCESHEGRPTKIEGNPDHPASLGATSALDQAAVLGLYDPDRAQAMRAPVPAPSWEAFFTRFAAPRPDAGERLRFLLAPTGSPLVASLVDRVRARFPRARFTFHAAARPGFAEEGARLAFGAPAQAVHDYRAADVILSLDDDFLASGPFSLRYARQWAERRRPASPDASMSRLYVAETMLTPTGTMADHRLRLRPSEVVTVAAKVAAEVAHAPGARNVSPALRDALARFRPAEDDRVIRAIAADLVRHAGAGVVTVGAGQPAIVHAIGHLIDVMTGNDGRTTWTIAPTLVDAGDAGQGLDALANELAAGAVDTLVILADNPAFTAPADLDLTARIAGATNVVYLGLYEDETAALANWFVPAAHPLESWGDAAAYDGTVGAVQPLLEPLYGGRTAAEILAVFAGVDRPAARDLLRAAWQARQLGRDFEDFWQRTIASGVVAGSASPPLARRADVGGIAAAIAAIKPPPAAAGALEIAFAPDPSVHDGRFANNPWLLEHPKPVTKLTWDNAAHLSQATAARLELADEDVVELELAGRRVRAPVLIVPGHADEAVTVHLGWGRTRGGSLAKGAGFDANRIRTAAAPSFAAGLSVHKLGGEKYELARTQGHFRTEGRPIALHATLAEYRKDPDFTAGQRGEQPSLMPPVNESGEQWAMTIDTSICTGCSACVQACQAENNILVVGKEQVLRSREMHWLRIDTYFHGPVESPGVVHEPMLCQHCEKAPCEYVCPVNATVHSPDGLNEMVYNRCVGTRFCSNNCPYKVRRFNWYDWTVQEPANAGFVMLQRNPDVTVRQRGVMEKCTYCVQRIREAEIHARVEQRAIREGEVMTACQEACPTRAIQFDSKQHTGSEMMKRREEPRVFYVLHELGTRPRTAYLARIDNPSEEIE